jgi:hypothetical protein
MRPSHRLSVGARTTGRFDLSPDVSWARFLSQNRRCALKRIQISQIGAVGLAVLCLLACYPRPHEYTKVSAISGVLLDNGKPVSGASVLIAQIGPINYPYCQQSHAVGVTDQDGHFKIDPVVRLHLFTSILNAPEDVLQTTTVCFQTASDPAFGMTIIARTNRTMSFTASCDLARPDRVFRGRASIPGNPRGICINPEEKSP